MKYIPFLAVSLLFYVITVNSTLVIGAATLVMFVLACVVVLIGVNISPFNIMVASDDPNCNSDVKSITPILCIVFSVIGGVIGFAVANDGFRQALINLFVS